jgi:transcriptional regulator with XRE-family HTH domain
MARQRAPEDMPDPRHSMWDLIAVQLRFQRNQRGLSGEAFGRILNISKSKVSRLEVGEERLDGTLATTIDEKLDTGGLFGLLVWYASLGHDPEWFAQYVELEQRATFLRIYQALTIPGLFQTEAYARALLMSGIELAPEAILAERMQRQLLLGRSPAPHLAAIISQSALEWPIGSPEIMRDQLDRLIKLAELPHVSLRVIPRSWAVGAHAGLAGSFQLLHGDDFGEVAYTEAPGAGRLVSAPPDVTTYAIRYEQISGKALAEGPSVDLIQEIMEAVR